MSKIPTGLTIVLVLLGSGRAARAQTTPFAEKGGVLLSMERVFGYVHTEQTFTVGGADTSASADTFTVFGNPISTATVYGFPRVGLDLLVGSHVTFGGSAAFFHLGQGSASVDGFMAAPRVGYLAMLGPKLAAWPRGGLTVQYRTGDTGTGDDSLSSTFFALTIEVPLAVLVAPHVALLLGPSLDLGLAGSLSAGGQDVDMKATEVSMQSGLLVAF